MDPIKLAFDKIKDDIFSLKLEIQQLQQEILELKAQKSKNSTIPTQTPAQDYPPVSTPAHFPAMPSALYPPISSNIYLSTGNGGVPTDTSTDRQTNQQTDQQTQNNQFLSQNSSQIQYSNSINLPRAPINEFERANEILNSLDNIKKEIRLKFKRLTPQEMLVFSTIYALEEQNIEDITYKVLSQHLNLTESSIRDYINKLTQKGVPILKIRQNNKKITLKISPDLQKIASLATIMKLREI
jgi:biotin operon repressor